jgi:hypothetical protein
MSPRVLLLLFLRRWHMRIGLAAVVFFLFLAVTGAILNHTAELGLDNRYVHAPWIARWYGVPAEAPRLAFRSGRHELIAANGRWVLDGRLSGEKLPAPIGLVELPDMIVVASSNSLYLYGKDGVLIDRLERSALPGVPVQAIGAAARQLVVRTASGTFESSDALSWQRAARGVFAWSSPADLSPDERERFAGMLQPGISAQRLLLDMHSGRIAGRYGPLAVDLLAVFLTVLSLSGAWLFFKRKHRRERQ